MEFGTGCLKITPAHDINDYEIGLKHNLPSIDIFNDNGTLNEAAQLFVGVDRFEARKQILPELEKAGNIVKIEDYNNLSLIDVKNFYNNNYQLSNLTLYWNYTGPFSADSTNIITGTANQTTFQKTNLNEGTILWNCLAK